MNKWAVGVVVLVALLGWPSLAFAYLGPGLSTGVIATVLGIVLGLLMLLVGVIWYPLKRLIKWLIAKVSK